MYNEERLLAWVEELESGNRTQTQDFLRVELPDGRVENCCIGVLAEQAESECGLVREAVEDDLLLRRDGTSREGVGFDFRTEPGCSTGNWGPTKTLSEYLGFTEVTNSWGFLRRYAEMNDERFDFDEIAAQVRLDFGLAPSPKGVETPHPRRDPIRGYVEGSDGSV